MWLSIVYYSWPLDSRGPDLGPDCDRNQCGRRGGDVLLPPKSKGTLKLSVPFLTSLTAQTEFIS